MGRKAKDKQLVAQASRRRTVLQIDRVSRRVGDAPVSSGVRRTINPNSVTGIGLLGSYDHSDEEDDEGNFDKADGENETVNNEDNSAVPSTSTGQHSEIDAKLADFFKEIESMDADTTSTFDDRLEHRQQDEPVSSTTEDERPMMSAAEGYEGAADADYNGNEGDMYPWQACLDEATNCYYYWNVETNEVQWHPPEQLSSAAPDTQTVEDRYDGEEKGKQGFQEDKGYDAAKEIENEEKQSEDTSENGSKEANSKDNIDNDIDSFQVVDSWEDKDSETARGTKAAVQRTDKSIDDEEVPAKRPKLVEVDDDSDDDFAVQLLEDTYEKAGKQDILVEESMEMSEDETDKEKDDDDKEEKPLLPPEVFEHLKTAAGTEEKKEEKSVTEEKKSKYNTEEEDYRSKILELTSVLTNKLDFLEVSRQGVSDLRILLIEMETRISDWREGALDSRHLISKLREADKQLKQYEESAAPPGWSCHWDRTHKRYYYTNKVTGDSQWEYPSGETATDSKKDGPSLEAPIQSSAATVTSNQSIAAAWNYSAYVPMVQAPAMSVVMPTVSVVSSSVKTESFANPPVPGTDDGSEAVPFTASFPYEEEESPPPPPGTDDLPPLPPVESSAPPPPPPEPIEAPPPPPAEEMPTPSAPTSASLSRPIVDYSDLDMASASPPPPPLPAAVPQSTGIQLSTPLQETAVARLSSPAGVAAKQKVKKKKKSSKVGTTLLSSKARKVSSLVQKWQSVKQQQQEQEPILDSSEEEEEENDPARQIEDWKKEQMESGQAAYNPNFQEIKGDWRERIRQRQTKAKSGAAAADQKDT